MTAYRKIAVLLGGRSAERAVSLTSGRGVARALTEEGFAVEEIDPQTDDLAARLDRMKPDAVFNALHGRWGEDGCVQGVLELLRIPYTHSGVLASALAMHKERAKDVFRAAGLQLAPSMLVERHAAARQHAMAPPYVVKPVNEGSSVGVFIVHEGANRPPGMLASDEWRFGEEVMIEQFVPGRELTVAVMGGKALGVTEITTALEFYDYDAKYKTGGSRHILPADVPAAIAGEAMALSVTAHASLGCRGVTRSDFRYDDTGAKPRLVLLEVNTQPGMTPTSLVPEQAALHHMSYRGLCRWIIEDASCDR